VQELTVEALACDAPAAQDLLHRRIDRRACRIVAPVPHDAVGTRLAQERFDDGRAATAAQQETGAPLGEVARKRVERVMQPPAPRAADRPDAGTFLIEDE
jgi:hypothetical protein